MIRAIALSLALLLGIGVIIPIATDAVEAGAKKKRRYVKKRKKVKKYSKRWWRQYRARQRRQRALAARKRALRLRQIRLAKMRENTAPAAPQLTKKGAVRDVKEETKPAVLPNGDAAPKTWKPAQQTQAEVQFRVDDDNGSPVGQAAISVVGPATGNDDNPKSKTVGGVPTTSLRRNVIDRMVRENGWVVNDFQKEVGGRKVYVVVAQAEGAGGKLQSRIFYFTEADGRIYSVSTTSSGDATERIAEESEKVINSLIRRTRNNGQQADLK